MKNHETVRVELSGRNVTVWLNRPAVRNAFHPTMIRELTDVFVDLSREIEPRIIVLRGEGKSFCAGADLGYMKSMAGFSLEKNIADSEQLFGLFWSLRQCPHPVVGLVHGHVMGGALGLLALCDIAAAVDETQFCFSEVRLGLAPAVISPFVLEKMSVSHARRYMLTAEVFSCANALASGLIQFHGDARATEEFVDGVVATLLANGAEAVRATKQLLRAGGVQRDWDQIKKMTTRTISERRVSDEGQEGLRSFFEKRAPKWKGSNT